MPGAVPKTRVCLTVIAAALGACSAGDGEPSAPTQIAEKISALYARSAARATAIDDPGDLTDAARRLLARARLGLHDIPAAPAGLDRAVTLPKTIRVWRRSLGSKSSCSGQVDVFDLEEYVKGVLPHEWIVSWEVESLRAGAVAIRSYAASWVQRGGKYTCADLDDTTYSQVYKDDRHPKASAAVDDTRGEVVVKDGAVVFAEYSAENGDPTKLGVADPPCAGKTLFGHGRGMCQWGSQRWATQGKAYRWIAEHYYPGATLFSSGATAGDSGSADGGGQPDAGGADDGGSSSSGDGDTPDRGGGDDARAAQLDASTQSGNFGSELRGGCAVGGREHAAGGAASAASALWLLLALVVVARLRRRASRRRAAPARNSRAAGRTVG